MRGPLSSLVAVPAAVLVGCLAALPAGAAPPPAAVANVTPAGPPVLPSGSTWDGKRFTGGPAVTEFPAELNGLRVIAVPRGNGGKPAPEWSFRTNLPAIVYLGVMDRAGYVLPAEWEPTAMEIRSGNLIDRVYRRTVPAGKVTVPGHTGMAGPFFGVPHLVIVAADDGRQADG